MCVLYVQIIPKSTKGLINLNVSYLAVTEDKIEIEMTEVDPYTAIALCNSIVYIWIPAIHVVSDLNYLDRVEFFFVVYSDCRHVFIITPIGAKVKVNPEGFATNGVRMPGTLPPGLRSDLLC